MGHLVEGGEGGRGLQKGLLKRKLWCYPYSALQAIDTSCHLCYDFCYSLKKEKRKRKKKVKQKRDRGKTSNEKGKC